jgi:hypothetical protein
LLPIAPSTSDESCYFENSCIVRQFAAGNGNLAEGGLVIEITVIGDPRRSEMRFTMVGAEA